ncbi:MAG TPA: copper homeostasis protein CutC, partial [Ginsengibacter sp.]|nr:copper homeostasis protein CutC [Ginsengibacter sp.]
VTFHRAFDRTKDPFKSMEDIIEMGCERILTSGQHPKAVDGMEIIKQLILQADDRIIIMPGSGVSSKNIIPLAENTGAVEFHSSASMSAISGMKYQNESMPEKMDHLIVNKEEVKKMVDLLEQFSNSAIPK